MANKKQQPGLMLYYDDLRAFREVLSHEQLGKLLLCMLDYSSAGRLPEEDCDPMVRLTFGLIRVKLDWDKKRYTEIYEKHQYAAYCREADKRGHPRLSLEDWRELRASSDINDDRRYPTSTESSTSTSSSSSTAAAPYPQNRPSFYDSTRPLSQADFERRRREAIQQLRAQEREEYRR